MASSSWRAVTADIELWQIAADLMAKYGGGAEREAVRLANEMLAQGDRERQVEWLRVRTLIVVLASKRIKDAAE